MTSQPHSPSASLLDEIALALDVTSLVLANWYHLAIKLGVPREDCWNFEKRSTQSPTNELFQYLETTRPQMTLKKLKQTLHELKRMDLLYYLDKQSLEGNVQLVRGQKIKNIKCTDRYFLLAKWLACWTFSFLLCCVTLDKSLCVNLFQCVTNNTPSIDIPSKEYNNTYP